MSKQEVTSSPGPWPWLISPQQLTVLVGSGPWRSPKSAPRWQRPWSLTQQELVLLATTLRVGPLSLQEACKTVLGVGAANPKAVAALKLLGMP